MLLFKLKMADGIIFYYRQPHRNMVNCSWHCLQHPQTVPSSSGIFVSDGGFLSGVVHVGAWVDIKISAMGFYLFCRDGMGAFLFAR